MYRHRPAASPRATLWRAMIRDAAEGYLAVVAERGEEIPAETFGSVVAEIEVPVPATAAVA